VGGAGSDVLTGGADADRFVFDTALGATNVDTIKDFAPGTEKIVLSAKIFIKFKGSIPSGSIAQDNFVVGAGEAAKANDGNDYLIYDTATDLLYYDADGSGKVAAAVAFAKVELIGADAPAFGDFLVVS
jgi:Ca2+-binding RTX toxin-like protein